MALPKSQSLKPRSPLRTFSSLMSRCAMGGTQPCMCPTASQTCIKMVSSSVSVNGLCSPRRLFRMSSNEPPGHSSITMMASFRPSTTDVNDVSNLTMFLCPERIFYIYICVYLFIYVYVYVYYFTINLISLLICLEFSFDRGMDLRAYCLAGVLVYSCVTSSTIKSCPKRPSSERVFLTWNLRPLYK